MPSKHTKLYLLFLLRAYHPKACITNASKICQFLRFGSHPYKLATLRANIGLIIIFCYSIEHTKSRDLLRHNSLLLHHKTFVARNKFPHVKVARNTEKVGQAWLMASESSRHSSNRISCKKYTDPTPTDSLAYSHSLSFLLIRLSLLLLL